MVPWDSPVGSQEGVLSASSSHSESLECACRCPLQVNSDLLGVVSGQRVIRSDSDSSSRSADRHVCFQEQQSASVVHLPVLDSVTACGRFSSGLEPVGEEILLPSQDHVFFGFGEFERLQGAAALVTSCFTQLPLVLDSSEVSNSGCPTVHPQLTQRVQNREVKTSFPHFWVFHVWLFTKCLPRSMDKMLRVS